ncbi:pilus assembly PilX family protein [Pseudoalteromonas nigrifaciens]|uniref:pilus assembly PilX family protein n=1 Tax=Pseudoalteromonas nigrifaciens TaxID=28109 RepID=UPI003FD23361
MENLKLLPSKQQGVVLITALIMVIAVTGIAITLMSSSTIDIKITNAAQEREVAENELIGNVQRVVAREASKNVNGTEDDKDKDRLDGQSGQANELFNVKTFFLTPEEVNVLAPDKEGILIDTKNGTTSKLINLSQEGLLDLNCPRSFNFTAGISCNMLQVTTTIGYGSKSKHELTIVTGVAQEMASTGKGI